MRLLLTTAGVRANDTMDTRPEGGHCDASKQVWGFVAEASARERALGMFVSGGTTKSRPTGAPATGNGDTGT